MQKKTPRLFKILNNKTLNIDQLLPNLNSLTQKGKIFFTKLRPQFFQRTINILLKKKVKVSGGT
jgi:hypothetical protein